MPVHATPFTFVPESDTAGFAADEYYFAVGFGGEVAVSRKHGHDAGWSDDDGAVHLVLVFVGGLEGLFEVEEAGWDEDFVQGFYLQREGLQERGGAGGLREVD